jgi:hypothetical protein
LLAYVSNFTLEKQNDQMHHIKLHKITLPMILEHILQAIHDLQFKKFIN